ncbi:hypothetical protein HK405_003429, partial [Cladochytrium tenue]
WGGGGWGNPLQRDADLVALEVRRGLVTKAGARRYGVVLTDDLAVDAAATAALRAELAPLLKRPEGEVFHRGKPLEDLIRAAKEETGLDAPRHPAAMKMRGPHTKLPYVKEWIKSFEGGAKY